MTKSRKSERAKLIEQLDQAGRASSTAAVMFHSIVAELQGLSATEEKALELLDRHGPLTAGELSAHSGLAPASVTGLIDRLERKGFARRVQDQEDKRRVRVEVNHARMAAFVPLFEEFMNRLHALYENYTADELRVVLRFMTEITVMQQDVAIKLKQTKR